LNEWATSIYGPHCDRVGKGRGGEPVSKKPTRSS